MKRKLIYESPSLEDLESLLKIVCSGEPTISQALDEGEEMEKPEFD